MLYSKQRQFMFFCNPKTGTTSIESQLSAHCEETDELCIPGLFPRRHVPPLVAQAFYPRAEWDRTFKFIFVRDPYDWVVSQYRWNFPVFSRYFRNTVRKPTRLVSACREYLTYREWIHRERIDAEAVEFLYQFLRQFRCVPQYASLFQSTYAEDVNGNQIVDFVGRFETFERSIEQVSARIGLEFSIPRLNSSRRGTALDTLTIDGRQLVNKLWQQDFDAFGYSPLR